ncbi:MAG: cytochrome b N-terminal domain-containing protein [Desulfuromusa sp.]
MNTLVKEFFQHLFPRIVLKKNLKLTYTFCLGGLCFTAFILLLFTGALLLLHYQPDPDHAFESILHLERNVFGGQYLRSLHRLSSHAFLSLLFLHTLRVILTGAYRRPRELNWIIGFLILCLSLFAGYTGYLLPMDQLALWATQTGMKLVELLPGGFLLKGFLVPDGVGQGMSLMRFYVIHVVFLPTSILGLSFLHFYRIRRDKGVLPYL